MTSETLIIFVSVITTVTGLVVEAIKKIWKGASQFNALAGIVAVIVTFAMAAGYAIWNDVDVNSKYAVFFICVAGCSWLGSMCGFDKVKQMIQQVGK